MLCRREGFAREGWKKDLEEKVISGLRSQGYAMFLFCTFCQRSPTQLASLDPHFPERKTRSFAFQVMLNFSPVRGTQLADTCLALALAPQGVRNFQLVGSSSPEGCYSGWERPSHSIFERLSVLPSFLALCHVGCCPSTLPSLSNKCSVGPEAMRGDYTSRAQGI